MRPPKLLIQHRISLLAGGLLLVLGIGSALFLKSEYQKSQELYRYETLGEISLDLSEAYCLFNNCRHLIAGYMRAYSGELDDRPEYKKERIDSFEADAGPTIEAFKTLNARIDAVAKNRFSAEFTSGLDQLRKVAGDSLELIESLSSHSPKNEKETIQASEDLQDQLLAFYDVVISGASDTALVKTAVGVRSFLEVKRLLWRIRGRVFTLIVNNPEEYFKYGTVTGTAQQIEIASHLRALTLAISSDAVKNRLVAYFESPEAKGLWDAAEAISRSGIGPGSTREQAAAAYQASTHLAPQVSKSYYELSERSLEIARDLSKDLSEHISQRANATRKAMLWVLVFIAAVFAVSVFVAVGFIKRLVRDLREISSQLSSSVSTGATASAQLADSSLTLAEHASQQAAAIEEISAAVEQISLNSRKNGDLLERADSRVSEALATADHGSSAMNRMTEAMTGIVSSSNEVSHIIQSIEDIAFQTNILALNAAVEAARAGESGAGFAVVADEVRALAQRCSGAATETNKKISNALKHTEHGQAITKEVAKNFTKLADGTHEISSLVQEVKSSVGRQSLSVDEMNTVIQDMANRTQEIAATSEENASFANSVQHMSDRIAQEANHLRDQVARTKQKEEEEPANAWSMGTPRQTARRREPAAARVFQN